MSWRFRWMQTARDRACRQRGAGHGFTLLEVLVVLLIIGVIASVATLSFGVLGQDRQAEEETRRFWAVVRQAREEAQLQSLDVAIFVSAAAYQFLRFDTRHEQWIPIVDDRLYTTRELPEGLRFKLRLDAREVVLRPTPPQRSDKDESSKWPPQIMVLSNGDIMPFELRIERYNDPALWRVVGLADNDLRIERRDAGREWILIEQTRVPVDEDEDQDRRRVSDAR